jgi:uncharacterized protein (TIGR01244 family)
MRKAIDQRITISGVLGGEEIARLGAQGVRTLIDLRTSEEPVSGGLTPAEEQECACLAGVRYVQIPVGATSLDSRRVADVRGALWTAESPLVLHCASGGRAATFALIHVGCQRGWTVERCLEEGAALGVDYENLPRLRDFLARYVRRHSRAYNGAASLLRAAFAVARSPRTAQER